MIINVNGYAVSPENICGGTKGSHNNERLCFVFDETWEGLIKTVTFYTPKRDIVCLIPDGTLMLPWEVTEQSGVTRYVICGTDGSRTVMSAEGAITVDDTLTVSEEQVDRRTPGVLERITLFMDESENAYDAAAENARKSSASASDAELYMSEASDAATVAQDAKEIALSAKNEASASASAASDSADAASISAQSAKNSEDTISAYIQSGEFGIPIKAMDGFPSDAKPGVMYVKLRSESSIMNNFDKYIFMCPDGVLYYAWKCDDTVLYTENKYPQDGDSVYYAPNSYYVENTGVVTAIGTDGMRASCTGTVKGLFSMTRDSSSNLLIGTYSWERIKEEKPLRRLRSMTLTQDKYNVSISSDENSKSFMLNEFYLRVNYRTPTSKSSTTDRMIKINGTETGFCIPGNGEDGSSYLFRGVFLGDSLALYRIPDASSGGSEACVIVDCPYYVSDIGIAGASSNPLGKNTVIDIWGREEL